MKDNTMTRTIDQMVQQEIVCCLSTLVAQLVNVAVADDAIRDLCNQAQELCYPLEDYEEAATQAGWTLGPAGYSDYEGCDPQQFNDWQELCEKFDIEPYQREIFEHWAVSPWLAEKLEAEGERIDHDFAGMHVWGRTTSGQGIASDSVIEKIYAAINAKAT